MNIENEKYCIWEEMEYCYSCPFGYVTFSSDEVECSQDIEGAFYKVECLCTHKTRNEWLLERYPFLQLKNVWTNEAIPPSEDGVPYIEGEYLPKGWWILWLKFCEDLKNYFDEHPGEMDSFRFSQVKEKYGTLHINTFGASSEVWDLIHKYEHISQYVCLQCGNPARWETSGWIENLCDDCIKPNQKESAYPIKFDPIYKQETYDITTNTYPMLEIDCTDIWHKLYPWEAPIVKQAVSHDNFTME